MHSAAPLPLLFLLGPLCVSAVRIPFEIHYAAGSASRPSLLARADNANITVKNTQNAFYTTNITLGGTAKRVMLDTGSSDLWVAGGVSTTQDTGVATTLSYAVGQAKGDVNLATLEFAGYSVPAQAYLLVNDTSTFSADIQTEGYDGLIGLGPNSGSVVWRKLDKEPKTETVLNRIFSQNTTAQNYISVVLDRSGDPTDPHTGQMTISEVVPGLESITSQPKLEVEKVHKLTSRDQHWQVLLDKDGLIGPDGQVIQHDSIVSGNDERMVAVLDTGFTFSQVPRKVSDAIYGRVPGAVYDTKVEMWTIPCDIELNITFKYGGVSFPIHPLDTSDNNFRAKDAAGNPVCQGSYQPITTAYSLLGEYDMILGMNFLRNAYTLIDFGDFVLGASKDQGKPYVQMLPLTDPATAHASFVSTRLGGLDTTGDTDKQLVPAAQGLSSPQSDAEKKQHLEGKVLRQWPYIFLGCFVFVAAVVGFTVWKCCCGRNRKQGGCCGRRKAENSVLPSVGGAGAYGYGGEAGQKYRQIDEPLPMHMKEMSGYRDPYGRG